VKPSAITPLERALVAYARNFPLRRGKLRLIEYLWRAAVGSGNTGRVAHLKYAGLKITCDLTGMLQRQLYFFGTYFVEEEILKCWMADAREAKVVFDVGANFGIYSLAALASQPNAIVHAFEPTPEIANNLRQTVELNCLENLFVHEAAVSDRNGRGILRRVGGVGANEGMNYLCAPTQVGGERVQTVCLDEFCYRRNIVIVDLLKLDVQGHEHLVLRGAKDLIRRGALRAVYVELNWQVESGTVCPATESIRLLADAGYRFASPAHCQNWREAGLWLHSLSDVIARKIDLRKVSDRGA
jgi:FkbM family methyltransferase